MSSTFTLSVFGSLKDVPRTSSWLSNGWYEASTAAQVQSYGVDRFIGVLSRSNLAANESDTIWIPTRSGPGVATFSLNAQVPDNGIDVLVHDITALPVVGVRAAGGGQARYTTTLPFVLADRPVQLFLRNRGPQTLTAGISAVLTWEAD